MIWRKFNHNSKLDEAIMCNPLAEKNILLIDKNELI